MAQRLALRSGGRKRAFDFRRGKVEFKADIVVLGAGMVGVSAALHLQQRGRDVILVDKHELAGEETSYGNAGLIECASVFPYMFPRDFGQILRYALNRAPQVRYAVADLPVFLPWLVRYYLASSPERALHSALAELPLIRRSLIEHEALIAEAGVPQLLRKTGWIKLFRSEATLAGALRDRDRAKQYGVEGETLDAKDIAEREPALTGDFAGGDLLADARLRSRSRRAGQSLCGAVRAQGRTLSGRRRQNARTARRRMAHRRRQTAPSSRAKSWWRWARGRIRCFVRSDIRSRSPSSAAIICIFSRAAMPCSIIPCSIPIPAFCWRR